MESESNKNNEQALTLFLQHERLVEKVWHDKFQWVWGEKDDLMQVGRMGLWNACITYDPKMSNKFITYAYYCIRNEMGQYTRREIKYKNRTVSYDVKNQDGEVKNILQSLDNGQYEQMINETNFKIITKDARHPKDFERLYNGKNFAEIAKEDGVTKEAIRIRVKRARAKIVGNIAERCI